MRPITKTVTGIGVSAPIAMDLKKNPFSVGFGCDISATATYTVQHTFDDLQLATFDPTTAKWYDHPAVAAATADDDGTYAFPVSAIRLNVAASTGSVTMRVIQSGN